MKLRSLLALGFLVVAAFVPLVAWFYKLASDRVEAELDGLRARSIAMVTGASEMRLALQAGQAAVPELIAERLRLRLESEPSHESEPIQLTASAEAIEQSLDEFDKRLGALRELSQAERLTRLAPVRDDGEDGIEKWLGRLETAAAVHRERMERFVHLSRWHPTGELEEYRGEVIEPHYRDEMLPLIRAYEKHAEGDLAAGLQQILDLQVAANRRNLLITALSLATALAVSFLIARRILRPVGELEAAARRVAAGDLSERVEVRSTNEIGLLGRTFNTMMDDLQATTVSLAEKEVLLREIHHRVKNNLQIVSSLLSLPGDEGAAASPARSVRESRDRIRSMALIHEQLYRSDDLARVDFADYLERLLESLTRSHGSRGSDVEFEVQVEAGPLEVDRAIPCGMIVNELVANALEHAFPDGAGRVRIAFENGDGGRLEVRDDGVGLPAGFALGTSKTLGLRLVEALAGQLGGELRLESDGGTRAVVTLRAAGRAGEAGAA